MTDAWHRFGSDLAVGPTGDIARVDGVDAIQQRLLRRLLTNPGDYIWQPDYGAGLGQFVGQPVDVGQIEAVIRSQIFKEDGVARQPQPTVEVVADLAGVVSVQITYAAAGRSAAQGASQTLAFTIGG